VILHRPLMGQIIAVASPLANSIKCLSYSESISCMGFRRFLLSAFIPRTVPSQKSDSWPQSHLNEEGISSSAILNKTPIFSLFLPRFRPTPRISGEALPRPTACAC